MEALQIWPNEDVTFGQSNIEGVDYVMMMCTESTSGRPLEICFRFDHFVSVSDQFADVARRLLDDGAGAA